MEHREVSGWLARSAVQGLDPRGEADDGGGGEQQGGAGDVDNADVGELGGDAAGGIGTGTGRCPQGVVEGECASSGLCGHEGLERRLVTVGHPAGALP